MGVAKRRPQLRERQRVERVLIRRRHIDKLARAEELEQLYDVPPMEHSL